MLKHFSKLTILSAFIMIAIIFYHLNNNEVHHWKNLQKPQLFPYLSLEKDQDILKELDQYTTFNSYKALEENFFQKQNIFEAIQP